MAGKVMVETERLILREFDEDDLEIYFELGRNPEIIRFTGDPGGGFKDHEAALEYLTTRTLSDYRERGYGRWAVVVKETGNVIGFSGLKYLDDRSEVDVGYRLLPSEWGKGYATESAQAAVDYGFNPLGLKRMIGMVMPENIASARVLEKIGMTFVEMTVDQGDQVAIYVIERE